ncbi:MAG TPA: hypothetical protein PLF75_08815 [Bacteroidales bacterium]|nr:hypothetical protein [Bacteroidales bacterium]
MPYRRLPNTDAARLKAMRTAYQKGKELPPFKLAFSQATFQKLQSFLPILEKNIAESRFTYENQIKKSKEYQQYLRKARIYISHFLQVMNMAIERGELPASTRTFFGLNEDDTRLPRSIVMKLCSNGGKIFCRVNRNVCGGDSLP